MRRRDLAVQAKCRARFARTRSTQQWCEYRRALRQRVPLTLRREPNRLPSFRLRQYAAHRLRRKLESVLPERVAVCLLQHCCLPPTVLGWVGCDGLGCMLVGLVDCSIRCFGVSRTCRGCYTSSTSSTALRFRGWLDRLRRSTCRQTSCARLLTHSRQQVCNFALTPCDSQRTAYSTHLDVCTGG